MTKSSKLTALPGAEPIAEVRGAVRGAYVAATWVLALIATATATFTWHPYTWLVIMFIALCATFWPAVWLSGRISVPTPASSRITDIARDRTR